MEIAVRFVFSKVCWDMYETMEVLFDPDRVWLSLTCVVIMIVIVCNSGGGGGKRVVLRE